MQDLSLSILDSFQNCINPFDFTKFKNFFQTSSSPSSNVRWLNARIHGRKSRVKNLLPTRLLDRVYSGDYQKLRNRKQVHCLLSYVLPADEHKVRIRNCNKRACIPKVENACAHPATRLFPSERGREEEKGGERVLPRETLYHRESPRV